MADSGVETRHQGVIFGHPFMGVRPNCSLVTDRTDIIRGEESLEGPLLEGPFYIVC